MTDGVPIRGSLVIPSGELSWRFSRSGGPGGQGVNTADSRVELSWDLARSQVLPAVLRDRALQALAGRLVSGVITVVASEHRSQLDNRRAAAARLAATIRAAVAPPPRARQPTKPSRAAERARLDAKRRHGRLKQQRRSPPE
jgi:ribosome-associated protein